MKQKNPAKRVIFDFSIQVSNILGQSSIYQQGKKVHDTFYIPSYPAIPSQNTSSLRSPSHFVLLVEIYRCILNGEFNILSNILDKECEKFPIKRELHIFEYVTIVILYLSKKSKGIKSHNFVDERAILVDANFKERNPCKIKIAHILSRRDRGWGGGRQNQDCLQLRKNARFCCMSKIAHYQGFEDKFRVGEGGGRFCNCLEKTKYARFFFKGFLSLWNFAKKIFDRENYFKY